MDSNGIKENTQARGDRSIRVDPSAADGPGLATRGTAAARAIVYEGREHNAMRVAIRPRCDFPAVLRVFSSIRYPRTGVNDERISFAILELVSNSMRAHQERERVEPIEIRLWIEDAHLRVRVSDRGGGFDPALLPYSLSAPADSVDVMAKEFMDYRERYENSRFGMGLVAARRIFPVFSLNFIDRSDTELRWPSPRIEGTRIVLGLPLRG